MKKLNILLTAAMLLSLTTFAQKKTWLIDMDGSYDRQQYTAQYPYPTQSLENWSVHTAVGRQFSDHFTIGLYAGIGKGQFMGFREVMPPAGVAPFWEAVKYSSTEVKIGIWTRYTYWFNKRFFLYGQLSAGHQSQEAHQLAGVYNYYAPIASPAYSPSGELPQAGFSAILFPAIGVNIINGYGVHMNIGGISYSRALVGDGNGAYNRLHLNFGQQFSFGLHKIIGWKKMAGKPSEAGILSK